MNVANKAFYTRKHDSGIASSRYNTVYLDFLPEYYFLIYSQNYLLYSMFGSLGGLTTDLYIEPHTQSKSNLELPIRDNMNRYG